MFYTLRSMNDFRRRCINESCRATLNMSQEELWEYRAGLNALLKALELGRSYSEELKIANHISRMFESPYTIEIVEIP
jgi:DNA-binding XRE family transcriptional regulator